MVGSVYDSTCSILSHTSLPGETTVVDIKDIVLAQSATVDTELLPVDFAAVHTEY